MAVASLGHSGADCVARPAGLAVAETDPGIFAGLPLVTERTSSGAMRS